MGALRNNGFTKVIVDGDTRLKLILNPSLPPSEIVYPPPLRVVLQICSPLHRPSLLPAARPAPLPLPLPTPVRVSFPLPHVSSPRFSAAPPASAASPRRLPLRLATKWRSKMTAAAIARQRRPSRHPSGSSRRRGWPRPVLPPPPSAGTESSAQRDGGPFGRENAAWCVLAEFSFLAATLFSCH